MFFVVFLVLVNDNFFNIVLFYYRQYLIIFCIGFYFISQLNLSFCHFIVIQPLLLNLVIFIVKIFIRFCNCFVFNDLYPVFVCVIYFYAHHIYNSNSSLDAYVDSKAVH